MTSDPIADMLTRIRNAQQVGMLDTLIPFSKQKLSLARILLEEGYISDVETIDLGNNKKSIKVALKYSASGSVIKTIERASKPSVRMYRGKADIPLSMDGMGVTVVSTSKGMLTDKAARKLGVGGEIICYVA